MNEDRCTRNDPRVPWLCSCGYCSRRAAAMWSGYMDRVHEGDITLVEANALMDREASDD